MQKDLNSLPKPSENVRKKEHDVKHSNREENQSLNFFCLKKTVSEVYTLVITTVYYEGSLISVFSFCKKMKGNPSRVAEG